MKSVAELAREAGLSPLVTRNEAAFARFAALHKAEVIKELCADEEPVAWRTFDGEGGYDFRGYEWNEDYQSRWDANNPKHIGWVDALYPAETVSALQARVARLEKDVIHWKEARQNAMAACELILAEVEAALRSKK